MTTKTMTEPRVREYYYDGLKSLFLKQDSDWNDKAMTLRRYAEKFYKEITGEEKYYKALGLVYNSNKDMLKKAGEFKKDLNKIIHQGGEEVTRKDYLALYKFFVEQISFATMVSPDKETQDLLTKHYKETPFEKESRFRKCINDAIENKHMVTLFGYSSSNSDCKSDRTIEPIESIRNGKSVWAYEVKQDGTGALRQFRLDRATNVKVLDEVWANEECHSPVYVDCFGWARSTKPSIHIDIIIGPAAMNHLVEMCPESAEFIIPLGEDQWQLSADVHDLTPVKKFCQDYMSTITVCVPDELKEALGLEVSCPESQPAEPVSNETKESESINDSFTPEIEMAPVCGFKGMLIKIGIAIREYLQERAEEADARSAKTITALAVKQVS